LNSGKLNLFSIVLYRGDVKVNLIFVISLLLLTLSTHVRESYSSHSVVLLFIKRS